MGNHDFFKMEDLKDSEDQFGEIDKPFYDMGIVQANAMHLRPLFPFVKNYMLQNSQNCPKFHRNTMEWYIMAMMQSQLMCFMVLNNVYSGHEGVSHLVTRKRDLLPWTGSGKRTIIT